MQDEIFMKKAIELSKLAVEHPIPGGIGRNATSIL